MQLKSAVSALVLFTLALGASACGGLSPLTAEQKAQLKEVNKSTAATKVNEFARQHSQPGVSEFSYSLNENTWDGVSDSFEEVQGSVEDERTRRFQETVARALQDGRCALMADGGTSSATSANGGFKISGPRCPISLEMSVDASAQQATAGGGGKFKGALQYRVLDLELKTLNDVDQFAMTIESDVQARQNSLKAAFRIQGDVHSQKYGAVKFKFDASMEGDVSGSGKGQVVVRYEFKNFVAEGRVEGDAKTQKCTLNGEEVTVAEFSELMLQGLGSLGGGKISVSSDEGSGSSPAPRQTGRPTL